MIRAQTNVGAIGLAAVAAKEERTNLRVRFGILPEAGRGVLFVGKLIAKRRPFVALDAFARVRPQKRYALLLVGDGEFKSALQPRVEKGRIENVYFDDFFSPATDNLPRSSSKGGNPARLTKQGLDRGRDFLNIGSRGLEVRRPRAAIFSSLRRQRILRPQRTEGEGVVPQVDGGWPS